MTNLKAIFERIPNVSFFLSLSVLFFAISLGPVILFPHIGIHIGLTRTILGGIAGLLFVLSFFERKKDLTYSLGSSAYILVLFYFLTSITLNTFGFTQSDFPVLLWIVLSTLAFVLSRGASLYFLNGVLLSSLLSGIVGYFIKSQGALIYSDDHPSFLYRLIQLKENFPNIPFYNSLWNSGVEAREFFASGVLNVFILFSPLIYLFKPEGIYNTLIVALLFIILPSVAYLTGRLYECPKKESVLYAILSLTSSILWYRWALAYGTLGFVFSGILVPLNLCLFDFCLQKKVKISLLQSFLIATSFTLMFLWSPSILIFLLVLLFSGLRLKDAILKKSTWITLFFVLALNLPWVSVFYNVSGVAQFLTKENANSSTIESSDKGSKKPIHDASKFKITSRAEKSLGVSKRLVTGLRKQVSMFNPVVLFFGLLGLVLMRRRDNLKIVVSGTLALAVLGFVGPLIKPQLELDRMCVILAMLLCLPASKLISSYLEMQGSSIVRSSLIGLLALSPVWLWRVVSGETAEQYEFAKPIVQNLASAISKESGEGRTLFAGFILHELSSGHVAPLAHWTKKPLIASSYQHDRWEYVDVIPPEYRKKKTAGILEYLELQNVSLVVTHDRLWRKWFSRKQSGFERVWQEDNFQVFKKINFTSDYFLEGVGRVIEQDGDSVTLEVSSETAVIKFNYLPFLTSSNCTLSPRKISDSVTFIELRECEPSKLVVIKAKNILERML